jgi:hypothetical protein
MVDAVAKWPDSEEPNHSVSSAPRSLEGLADMKCNQGFQLANNTDKTMFKLLRGPP